MRVPEPGTQVCPQVGRALRSRRTERLRSRSEGRVEGGEEQAEDTCPAWWLRPKEGQLRQWQASDGLATPKCSLEGTETPT